MLTKFFCKLKGHGNLVRERHDNGEMGYRCEDCMTLLPNTLNQIAGIPTEPEYKAGKVGEAATPNSFKLSWG